MGTASNFTAEFWNLPWGFNELGEIDFSQPADFTGTDDALDTYEANGSFWTAGQTDNFAARYTATLTVTEPGAYTFYLNSDDGSSLSIDGRPVIDNDGLHGTREETVTVNLTAGNHPVEILYFEASGAATLALDWSGPDTDGVRQTLSRDTGSDDTGTGGDSGTGGTGSTADDEALKVNGVMSEVAAYGGDQDAGTVRVSSNDNRITLIDNAWKSIAIDETITEDTYLIFEYRSSAEGEVHAIGFDRNNSLSPNWLFQLDGTDTYGLQGENGQYTTGDNFQTYAIKVGDYFQGDFNRLVLAVDDDADASGNSIFRHITIADGEEVNVNGVASAMISYGGDQDAGTATVSNNDNRITLTDNAWKSIAIDETITEDTYLNFEYSSDAEGEIHAIGFDRNDSLSPKWLFQLDGTQAYGLQGENGQYTTGDGYQSYSIKVGDYFQGDFSRLVLAMDDDAEAGGNSMFRNITIEDRPGDTGGGTGGGTGGDTGEDPGGHDMGDAPSIPGYDGPIPPTTSAEINAFVSAVQAEADGMAHMGMETMSAEHMAAMDLVSRDEASHIAIANGDWDDPDTWYNGEVPGDGAAVLIPDGIMVNYDHISDVSLFTVRVDGMLRFATNVDSRMEVDTIVVSPEGYLQMGTEENPIQPGVNVDIVFADNGNIDTNWDPALLSRGMVSHGAVDIYGAEKTAHLEVAAAPMAGDTTLRLDSAPEGWEVGDKLVLTGTHLQGWYWDQSAGATVRHDSQDEEVYITGINGNTITLDRALQYDHDAPDGDFSAQVANMTRNVTFSSEGGEDLPVHQRGHVMFMHSDDVDVRYAGFEDLGRTDKSVASFASEDLGVLNYDSNIQGRYSFHFHRTGTEDQEAPAIAVGNVVDGNPGWGFVHHNSHAEFTDNVAFDVFGAAFAAEDGNETGIWLRNLAIDVEGFAYGESSAKLEEDVARHDNGRTGDGFFFAGRLVEAAENIAANATHGFVYMHRDQPLRPLSENLDQPEVAHGAETIRVDQSPIHGFQDNEAFASQIGLVVVKRGPDQDHEVRSVIDNFTAWEVAEGINLSYTSHYTLLDTTLIGSDNPYLYNTSGFVLGPNTLDAVMNGAQIEGFDNGLNFDMDFHTYANSSWRSLFIDVDISDNANETVNFNADRYTFLSSSDLTEGQLSFDMQGATVTSLGNGFNFDGIKTDSVGSTDRQFVMDVQGFDEWGEDLRVHLDANGYYELADGTNVILVEDFIADRATAELMKFAHVIELANSDSILQNIGYTNNGLLTPGGPAAVAGADAVSTGENEDVYINVLANDYDPDGGSVRVDGMVDPRHGDVFLQDDDTIMYRPNRDFTGTDSFRYWAADEEGNFTAATVTIEVWDGLV